MSYRDVVKVNIHRTVIRHIDENESSFLDGIFLHQVLVLNIRRGAYLFRFITDLYVGHVDEIIVPVKDND